MLELLQEIDVSIFKFINQTLSNSFFDSVLPLCREKLFWIPLYVFLLGVTITYYRKSSLIIILTSIVCILLADQISSTIMKPTFERTRPCNVVQLQESIHVLAPCRDSFSFTSSHATNHFAIATFFILVLGISKSRWRFWLIFWAGLVSVSQVYVGLHYPFDILIGGIIGVFIGWLLYTILYNYYLKSRLA